MPFVFAFASDHFWDAAIAAVLLAFVLGVYGHVIHSRAIVLAAIIAIAAITAFFVISGELNAGNAGSAGI